MDSHINELARELVAFMCDRGLTLATAESCTGGKLAAAITSVPGCSKVYVGGVVSYSNDVKSKVLGIDSEVLEKYGAVSCETVEAMALRVCHLMNCDCAMATSGIAGPDGGTVEKPVGTVWIAVNIKGDVVSTLLQLEDKGRDANICSSVENVLSLLRKKIRDISPIAR